MKKLLSLLLCCCLIFSLTSCSGKPEGMSETLYKNGCSYLQTVDDFFDEKITYEEFWEEINIKEELHGESQDIYEEEEPGLYGKTQKGHEKSIVIKDRIGGMFNVPYYIYRIMKQLYDSQQYQYDSKDAEYAIQIRNELATALGKEEKDYNQEILIDYCYSQLEDYESIKYKKKDDNIYIPKQK